MNARWDLFLPVLFVCLFAIYFFCWGYYEGKKKEQAKQLIVADYYRVQLARNKQLYDWETHGL